MIQRTGEPGGRQGGRYRAWNTIWLRETFRKGAVRIDPDGASGHHRRFGVPDKVREACNKAGVNKSAHGVRKIGATRAANNGATVAELEAIFGWSGGGMASLYTRAADRARLAKGVMAKLGGTASEQSIPAPSGKVRESGRKDQ